MKVGDSASSTVHSQISQAVVRVQHQVQIEPSAQLQWLQ